MMSVKELVNNMSMGKRRYSDTGLPKYWKDEHNHVRMARVSKINSPLEVAAQEASVLHLPLPEVPPTAKRASLPNPMHSPRHFPL